MEHTEVFLDIPLLNDSNMSQQLDDFNNHLADVVGFFNYESYSFYYDQKKYVQAVRSLEKAIESKDITKDQYDLFLITITNNVEDWRQSHQIVRGDKYYKYGEWNDCSDNPDDVCEMAKRKQVGGTELATVLLSMTENQSIKVGCNGLEYEIERIQLDVIEVYRWLYEHRLPQRKYEPNPKHRNTKMGRVGVNPGSGRENSECHFTDEEGKLLIKLALSNKSNGELYSYYDNEGDLEFAVFPKHRENLYHGYSPSHAHDGEFQKKSD